MEVALPNNLYATALTRFDALAAEGDILYGPSDIERIDYSGFKFEFRITSALDKKPTLSRDDPGRSHALGPFVDPDPRFVLSAVGSSHILELNMFCVYRPMLILHTKEYVEQELDLDASDITAAWATLEAIEEPQIVLYNCGADSGSSQGHKHLQLWPRDDFQLPPDGKNLSPDIPAILPGLPFKHWVIGIPKSATAADVVDRYFKLLGKAKKALEEASAGTAYNVLFVKNWMVIIPRIQAGHEGLNANGAGMLGSVWLKNHEERDHWTRLGMTEHLKHLSIPADTSMA